MNRIALLFSLSLAFNSFVFAQNFFDDFESYTVGEQLVVQNPNDWTTWSNSPGSAEDPFILELDSNVVEISGTNDLVYVIPNLTYDFHTIQFDIYIPDGCDAYFNTLQEYSGISSSWGMQVYFGFNSAGEGSIDGGGQNAANFNYDYDTWLMVKIEIDLDMDWAEFFLNDELIHGWEWSSGTFGTNSLNQLGGSNFYAWTDGYFNNPLYYLDNYNFDYIYIPPVPPPKNLNIYYSGFGPEVKLCWDPPGEGAWVQWDNGVNNGNLFGQEEGGTYFIASRFEPDDLVEYDGFALLKVAFFAGNDPDANYILKIWAGENADSLCYEQVVESFIKNHWNEYYLFAPVLIDASKELWIGYEVTYSAGFKPTGMDNGPAIENKGDLISFDENTWQSLSNSMGLDYNWNLKGLIYDPSQLTGQIDLQNQNVNAKISGFDANSQSFLGYAIFRSIEGGDFDLLEVTPWYLCYTDYAAEPGLYQYYVVTLDGWYNQSEPTDTVSAIVMLQPPPPTNLTVDIVGSDFWLNWEWPGGFGEWIRWDQQVNCTYIGLTAGGTFYCASHWDPADLHPFDGLYITKMNWYHGDNGVTASFVLKIWTGANAGNEVMSEAVSSTYGWNEVELASPVMIDASQELWFGYAVTHPAGENPAGIDPGPAIYGYGDMISLDGVAWESMGSISPFDNNWNLGACVGGIVDGKEVDKPMIKMSNTVPAIGLFSAASTQTGVYNKFIPTVKQEFEGFNIWHSEDYGPWELLETGVMETSYIYIEPTYASIFKFYVTAVVDGIESDSSNIFYIWIPIPGQEEILNENLSIYPNPATDFVNISSNYIIKTVNVYNFSGQVISEETVDSKFYRINTSSYNPGVYLFRITTDEGVISKTVVIE